MKNTLSLFSLFFLVLVPKAQSQDMQLIDSLLIIYNDEQSVDTSKIKALGGIFNAYLYYDQDKADYYLSKIYDVAQQMGDKEQLAKFNSSKGILWEMKGELDSAKVYYSNAIAYFEKANNRIKLELTRFNLGMVEVSQGNHQRAIALMEQNIQPATSITEENAMSQAISYGLLSRIYDNKGYYQLALRNALTALKIIETTGDELRIADALNDLANAESSLLHYQASIDYQKRAVAIYEKHGDKYFLANSLNNVGSTYIVLEDYPKALKSLTQSLALAKEVGSLQAEVAALSNLAKIYIVQGKLELGLQHLEEALAICEHSGSSNSIVEIQYYMGELYLKSGQNSKALAFFDTSIALADSMDRKHLLQDIYFSRSASFEAREDYKASLEDYKIFHELSETIYDTEQITAIEELRIIHDTEQKEKEIALLAKNAEVEALKKNRLWVMLIAAIGMGSALLWAQWQRRRKEQIMHQKEQEVEQERRKVAELKNQKLNNELDFKKQELASKVLQLCRKNEFLQSLYKDVKVFKSEIDGSQKNYLDQLSRKINRDIDASSDWEEFLRAFESVHPDFKKILLHKYPTFVPNEIRMAYLMRMNLESKDIANLLNITNDGVKKARYRMRKKMGKDSSVNLTEYFMNLGIRAEVANF